MATSTAQAIATVAVWDYLMNPGDPLVTTPKGLGGKKVKVSLTYSLAQSASPVTLLGTDDVTAQTDPNGFWQINLVPNNKISPSGTLYKVEIEGYRSYLILVKDTNVPAGGWQSAAIAILPPVGGGAPGYTLPDGTVVNGSLTAQSITLLPGPTLAPVAQAGSFNNDIWASFPTGIAATDTANIQAALTAVPAIGARVRLWPGRYVTNATLVAKSYTTLEGAGMGDAGLQGATQIYGQNMTTPIFDPGVGQVNAITIRNISFNSSNAAGSKGVHCTLANQLAIEDCSFSDFGEQAVHVEGGLGGYFNNLFIQRAVMVRTGRASLIGCFDMAADCFCTNLTVEASMVPGDGTGNICGIVIRANGLLNNCVGGTAQIGIATAAGQSAGKFVSCRGEFTNGPGWQVDGSTSDYVGCVAWQSSQAANNGTPGWNVTGPQNTFTSCRTDGLPQANLPSNGFNDSNSGGSGSNLYVSCRAQSIRGVRLVASGTQPPVEVNLSGSGVGTGLDLRASALILSATSAQNDLTVLDTSAVAGIKLQGSGGQKWIRVNGVNLEVVNNANTAIIATITDGGALAMSAQLYPGAEAANAQQVVGGILHSTGVPNNGNGNNNDWCISDNGHLYFRRAGVWADIAAAVTAQSTPGNPAGTASATGVMMGLAGSITPVRTGAILVIICGDIFNATAIADGGSVQIRTGTGSAPVNGNATHPGTAAGSKPQFITATTAEKGPFSVQAVVTGLTLGTAVWLDLELAAITGGTATIENVSISAVEV